MDDGGWLGCWLGRQTDDEWMRLTDNGCLLLMMMMLYDDDVCCGVLYGVW